jgi:microcystin-dependent protein
MTEPFISEIRIISFNFAPKGYAFCNGQLLPINQNQALFSLLGTTYGGDGRVNFGLPNLQGRVPIHFGNGHVLGESGGETSHTLTVTEMTAHNHSVVASSNSGTLPTPGNNFFGKTTQNEYSNANANTSMNPANVGNTGGSQPHDNMPPYLAVYFVIALQGIFPSQN